LYDIAIEGLEITPEHEEAVDFTIPYYVTSLQLCVRRDSFLVNSLEDCHAKIVGTMKESVAQYILESLKDVDIRAYLTEVNGFEDLSNGRLDAVLYDLPVALYYGGPRDDVKFVGTGIGRIVYGFAISKKNAELHKQVNEILTKMRNNGDLRRILDRWNMWNPLTANEFQDFGPAKSEPVMYQAWVDQQRPTSGWEVRAKRYVHILPIFGRAAIVTMEVSILAMLLAIICGFFLATVRVYAPQPFPFLATIYIEIIRGTPVLIQLFFIFYGLPALGIKLSPFEAGVIGLGMNYAAYEAENYRAGFISVPHSQMEAALALAMSRWQAIRYVVAPQAFRVVLPPVTNDFISLLKDSSLVSVITMVELTKAYGQVATTYYDYFGTGIIVAVIYLLLGLPFVRLARFTEKKLALAYARPR
jgi:polar amino acid transport system substrate-binding protein